MFATKTSPRRSVGTVAIIALVAVLGVGAELVALVAAVRPLAGRAERPLPETAVAAQASAPAIAVRAPASGVPPSRAARPAFEEELRVTAPAGWRHRRSSLVALGVHDPADPEAHEPPPAP